MDLVYKPAWPYLVCRPLSLGRNPSWVSEESSPARGASPDASADLDFPGFVSELNNPLFHINQGNKRKYVYGLLEISESASYRGRVT